MRNVYLHGHLATTYGDKFELEVATAGEALRALASNFAGFLTTLRNGSYAVVRGDVDNGYSLELEDVNEFRLGSVNADLHIVPVIEGAKSNSGGGFLKVILGVALAGAALFMSGGALGTAIGGGMLGGITWGNVAMIGMGLALAGASQLLSPQEKGEEEKDQSYTLSGAMNTYEQGNPVPLVYGEVIVGGHLISAGVDIEQLKETGYNAHA